MLCIEVSSENVAVLGKRVVITSFRDGQLLLDCNCGCGYKVPVRDATFEARHEPVRVTENQLIISQLLISLEGNQRVLLTENRYI